MKNKNTTTTLEDVYNACLRFLEPMKAEETYKRIVTEALKLVGANEGSVLIKKNKVFERAYTSAPELNKLKPRKNGFTAKAFLHNQPIIATTTEVIKAHPEFKKINIKSYLLVPISYGDDALGVLALQSKKKNFFTQEKIKTISLYCSMAFLTIRKIQLYNQAQEAIAARDLFIATASHELKSPLTTITIYSQKLKKDIQSNKTSDICIINTIAGELARMTRLINELFEANQIRTGHFHFKKTQCNLVEVMEAAITNFSSLYKNHFIIFENLLEKKHEIIVGDKDKLTQAFINVLNNAGKFSPDFSQIKISLAKKERKFFITIADKGKGIAQKDIHKIFDEFFKGTDKKVNGIGLGLFITKKIIEQHKGDISVTSQKNKGTTVTISLPLK